MKSSGGRGLAAALAAGRCSSSSCMPSGSVMKLLPAAIVPTAAAAQTAAWRAGRSCLALPAARPVQLLPAATHPPAALAQVAAWRAGRSCLALPAAWQGLVAAAVKGTAEPTPPSCGVLATATPNAMIVLQ